MMTSHGERGGTHPFETAQAMASTIDLLERFKKGDEQAVNVLVERSLPPLKRWARGRLPSWARTLADTHDLVQDVVVRALPRLKTFEARHQGSLQAYLRQAVANQIRDEIRRVRTHPAADELRDDQPDKRPSPLELAMGRQGRARYEAALAQLRPCDREAIIARVELQLSYAEVATALGKPNAPAARMAVKRAIQRLIQAMALTHGRQLGAASASLP